MRTKFSINRLMVELLPIAAFDTIYFLLVEDFSNSRWIGWGCCHVAYALLVASFRQTKSANSATVYGYPRIAISYALFLMVLVAFAIIFYTNPVKGKWPAIIEIVLTVGYLCYYFAVNEAELSARELEAKRRRDHSFVKECSNALLSAKNITSDSQCWKIIECAYDAVRSGDAVSSSATCEIEDKIRAHISLLIRSASAGEQARIKDLVTDIVNGMAMRQGIIRANR